LDLSGGEKQKIAIASVLVMQPDYLVMDEITALLDPVSRKEVLNLVHSIAENKNIGVLYITHITEEVINSDKVLVLHNGEKINEGIPAVILQDMKLLRSAGVASLPSIIISEDLRKHGIIDTSFASLPSIIISEDLKKHGIIDTSFVDEEGLVGLLCSN
jgi:energy-coupling factor transport system ATP-binding protein